MNTRLSKRLAYALRHAPGAFGLSMDDAGWVDASALIERLRADDAGVTREAVEAVVRENDKRRFEWSHDGARIRARQGHSVAVDLALPPVAPPDRLYHGTVPRFLAAIRREGLVKGARHHVHLSASRDTATRVGARRGAAVVLVVDAAAMHRAGHVFHHTDNDVWLTDVVPPAYLLP